MTVALEGGEWSAARPGRTLPPGKTRYPFYWRLGGRNFVLLQLKLAVNAKQCFKYLCLQEFSSSSHASICLEEMSGILKTVIL